MSDLRTSGRDRGRGPGRRWHEGVYSARFAGGSLLVHGALMLLLAWWTLPAVIGSFEEEPEGTGGIVGVPLPAEGEAGREAFEEVAELDPVERSAFAELVAQPVESLPDEAPRRLPPVVQPALRSNPREVAPPAERLPAELLPQRVAVRPFERRAVAPRADPVEIAAATLPEPVVPPVEPPADPLRPLEIAPFDRAVAVADDAAPSPTLPPPNAPVSEPISPLEVVSPPREVEAPRLRPMSAPQLSRTDPRERADLLADVAAPELPFVEPVASPEADRAAVEEVVVAEIPRAVDVEELQVPRPSAIVAETVTNEPPSRPSPVEAEVSRARDLENLATAVRPPVFSRRAPSRTKVAVAELTFPRPLPPARPEDEPASPSRPSDEARVEAAIVDPLQRLEPAVTESMEPAEPSALSRFERPFPRASRSPLELADAGAARASRADVEVERALTGPVRRRPSTTRLKLATQRPSLESMLELRRGPARREYLELAGGNERTEAAVQLGLKWLAAHQNPAGSWSLHEFHRDGEKQPNGEYQPGSVQSDTAATGLALLPFLAAGHTHATGEYREVVRRGLDWLVEHQQENGDLFVKGTEQQWMYSHGIAAIALCEAHGLETGHGDDRYRDAAQRAVRFVEQAQNPESGGWRYKPWEHAKGERGDTSVVGWQVMALKSGEMAGLEVSPRSYELARTWLDSAEHLDNGKPTGRFGYTGRGEVPAMTAEGLLCLQFLGVDRDDPRMQSGANWLVERLPHRDQRITSYGWYYATQVMFHMQGETWTRWNEAMKPILVETQEKSGPLAGSWKPHDGDQWERQGGRLYATCAKLLVLEVYHRYLPLFDQLGE